MATIETKERVFVVALQRTGTSSIEHALRRLGYRTVHFPYQLFDNPRHSVLNEFDAFTDNPIPIRYRELDQICPGSKFIHIVRPEEEWLDSVQWLFEQGSKEFDWDAWNGLIHRMHDAFYGRRTFNREVFRQRAAGYHAELKSHFADRPNDFLMIDLHSQSAMEELTRFLNKPCQRGPLPKANRRVGPAGSAIRSAARRIRRAMFNY